MNDMVLGPKTPEVSTVTGVKTWERSRSKYFSSFSASAFSATSPAAWVARFLYDGAYVSGHVTSQRSVLPCFQATNVAPSGLHPSLSTDLWAPNEKAQVQRQGLKVQSHSTLHVCDGDQHFYSSSVHAVQEHLPPLRRCLHDNTVRRKQRDFVFVKQCFGASTGLQKRKVNEGGLCN